MSAILSRGVMEWKKADKRLRAHREAWEKEFQESFTAKQQLWDQKYLGFLEEKEAWVSELTVQAVSIGNKQILTGIPAATRDAITAANDFIISYVLALPDTQSLMQEILNR
ncbi:MAG: hypothetical protein SVR04_02280 [Spirochaetota bacterium]|nr:hypothetical protein [Spirochaetota bacterium]